MSFREIQSHWHAVSLYHNITCCATRCDQSIIYTLKTDRIMIQTDRETFQMMLHQIMERFDRIEDRLEPYEPPDLCT